MKTAKRDSDLITRDEMYERLRLIRINRDIANDTPVKTTHVDDMRAKHKKICKLTEREGKLLQRMGDLASAERKDETK